MQHQAAQATPSARPPAPIPTWILAVTALTTLSSPTCAEAADEPTQPLPAVQAPGVDVRSLAVARTAALAPYVLELGEDFVTLAWSTREERAGRVELRGSDGAHSGQELVPTVHHRVTIDGLVPGTPYAWEVDGAFRGQIETYHDGDPLRFAVFGHPGGTALANLFPFGALAARLTEFDTHLTLCTGDLCYFTTPWSFGELFLRPFRNYLKERPIHVAAGNHDVGYPAEFAVDFGTFRSLFPYDYPSERGGYYDFVRGNVHFLSLAYHTMGDEDTEAQLAWAEETLRNSRSEFRVAFLGGANPPQKNTLPRIMETLTAGGVDAIFGGDGASSFQRKENGVDYFFAGTNHDQPHNFYVVTAGPYTMDVVLHDASLPGSKTLWTLESRRGKKTVMDVAAMLKPRPNRPNVLLASGMSVPSTRFHALRVTVRNPRKTTGTVWVRWGPEGRRRKSAIGMFREQSLMIKPGATLTRDIPLPARNPVTQKPWSLGEIEVRVDAKAYGEDYDLMKDLVDLVLVADPLRQDEVTMTEEDQR